MDKSTDKQPEAIQLLGARLGATRAKPPMARFTLPHGLQAAMSMMWCMFRPC